MTPRIKSKAYPEGLYNTRCCPGAQIEMRSSYFSNNLSLPEWRCSICGTGWYSNISWFVERYVYTVGRKMVDRKVIDTYDYERAARIALCDPTYKDEYEVKDK